MALADTIGRLAALGCALHFKYEGGRVACTITNDRAPDVVHRVAMPPPTEANAWDAVLYEAWRDLYDHLPGADHRRATIVPRSET